MNIGQWWLYVEAAMDTAPFRLFNGLPTPLPVVFPQFFKAQTPLPMYNVTNDVEGWKRLEITIEIMN